MCLTPGSPLFSQPPDVCRKALTAIQVSAIKGVQRSHDVKVLTIKVAGVPRSIVLVGELHVKTKKSQLEFAEVLKNFDHHAIEYASSSKFPWHLRVYGLPYIFLILKALPAVVPGLARSSIFDIKESADKKVVVELEKNLEPSEGLIRSVYMHFTKVNLLLMTTLGLPAATLVSLFTYGSIDPGAVEMGAVVSLSAALAHEFLPFEGSLLVGERDKVMSETLLKYFKDNPHVQVMVVTTGKGHTNGIYEILKDYNE